MTVKKYYRIDDVALEQYNRLILKENYYIEEKKDKRGRTYYLLVEDFINLTHIEQLKKFPNFKSFKSSMRVKNKLALHRINIDKLFREKPDDYNFDDTDYLL